MAILLRDRGVGRVFYERLGDGLITRPSLNGILTSKRKEEEGGNVIDNITVKRVDGRLEEGRL